MGFSPSSPSSYFGNREKAENVLRKEIISFQGMNLLLDSVLKYTTLHYTPLHLKNI